MKPYVCIVFAERRAPVLVRPFEAGTQADAIHRALGMTLSIETARGYELWTEGRKISAYYTAGPQPLTARELVRRVPGLHTD
jgi:hypothetical protein